MEVRAQQVIYGVAEVIAAHNLLRYVRKNDNDEKLRMATGAAFAGLGYVFGPELQQRIKNNDTMLDELTKQRLLYAAGGALLGGMLGHKFGARLPPDETIESVLRSAGQDARSDPQKPGGLLTIASAGWLGYSLFFDGKTTEERERHIWGLGAGVVGFAYGPEIAKRLTNVVLPKSDAENAIEIYANGSALIGSVAGGLLGWYKGAAVRKMILPEAR